MMGSQSHVSNKGKCLTPKLKQSTNALEMFKSISPHNKMEVNEVQNEFNDEIVPEIKLQLQSDVKLGNILATPAFGEK